jgi:nucleoside-diphosphate-sugar epimerase
VKPPRKVLIAGCGYIGSALAARLVARGDEVWGLRRRPGLILSGVHPLALDLGDPSLADSLPPGIDAVVYAASPGASSERAYRATFVDDLGNLIDALTVRAAPTLRLVFISSTRVYARNDGAWVDESSPPEAAEFRAACLLEGEARVRQAPFRGVVVRFGGIYGPGRRGSLDRALAGLPVTRMGRPLYGNRIHRDDGAGILEHLLNLEHPESLYLAVDSDPAARETVRAWLAERTGLSIPAPDASDSGSAEDRSNKRCSNRRILDSGYLFVYPSFREGFAALLDDEASGR